MTETNPSYFNGIDDKFFVDPANFGGHQYQQYKSKLMAAAMTTPSEYYDMQYEVIDKLNVAIGQKIYKDLFLLLTKGKLPNGTQLTIGSQRLNPAFPSQTAADFCIEAGNTINEIIRKATEIILPESHLDIAKMQMEKKSSTQTIK